MRKKGQLETLFVFIISILLFLSLIIYYFQFKTNSIPVFKPKKKIEPAERGVVPPGTFFEKQKNKNKLPFIFLKESYAKTEKDKKTNSSKTKKYKINKNLETYIISPPAFIILEDNKFILSVSGINKTNPSEKIYYEYQIKPLHTEWQKMFSNKILIVLPKEQNFYTLYVRSINKNYEVDPTPSISYIFTSISPYYQEISLDTDFKKEKIILKNKSRKQINITNWKIISPGLNIVIPRAVKDITPDLKINLEDIILEPNETVTIYANNSPLGFNFKVNKCFPFLAETRGDLKKYIKNYSFPCERFSQNQLLELKDKYRLSNNCIVNILKKISCRGPESQDWLKANYDSNCYNFLESRYTYNGCYQNKKNDEDFYLKAWLIFVNDINFRNLSKSYRYTKINLYDNKNLLVNTKIIY